VIELPIAMHAVFLLEEIINLKTYGSTKKLQKFLNGFDLQDRPFRRSVIIMDFIADELWVFAD
jgi:hypothetical protein